jgi:hypothetical protein
MMLNKLDQKKQCHANIFSPFFCTVIHDKMVGMSLKLRNFIICPPKMLILGNNLNQITCLLKYIVLKEAFISKVLVKYVIVQLKECKTDP